MDPDVADVIAAWTPAQFADPPAQRDAAMETFRSAAPITVDERVRVDDRVVERASDPPVPVRIYRPVRDEPAGTLVWFHGGAYCIGSIAFEDAICTELALGVGIVVVSVEYRLAPEDPFPAGFDDCFDVVSEIVDGVQVDVPGAPLAVGGTSAGAGLAAAVALKARDSSGPAIAFQLLLYPFLDDQCRGDSFVTEADAPVFTTHDAVLAWNHYLGSDRSAVPPYGAPARAADLSGLPPTYLLTAGLDCLRDDGLDYATSMIRAGGQVELHTLPTVPHGFLALAPDASVSQIAKAEIARALRLALRS